MNSQQQKIIDERDNLLLKEKAKRHDKLCDAQKEFRYRLEDIDLGYRYGCARINDWAEEELKRLPMLIKAKSPVIIKTRWGVLFG